jgi:hypothetical protein
MNNALNEFERNNLNRRSLAPIDDNYKSSHWLIGNYSNALNAEQFAHTFELSLEIIQNIISEL